MLSLLAQLPKVKGAAVRMHDRFVFVAVVDTVFGEGEFCNFEEEDAKSGGGGKIHMLIKESDFLFFKPFFPCTEEHLQKFNSTKDMSY